MRLVKFSIILIQPIFAIAAVGPHAKPRIELATELLKLPAPLRVQALNKQSNNMYDTLLEVVQSDEQSMNMRWRALTAAAQLRGQRSTKDIMKFSEAKEWYLRNASLVALAEVSPESSLSIAKKLIKDPALVVRSAAVEVIGKQDGDEERGLLWRELNSSYNKRGKQSLWIRPQIVDVLAKTPKPSELGQFAKLLSDKDEAVQKFSMVGLEKITGLQVAKNAASHTGAVRLWKAHINRLPSSELR